jgi:HEAT repeat protein
MKPMLTRILAAATAALLASCATIAPDSRALAELDGRLKAFATHEYGADRAPQAALSDFLTAHDSRADRKAIEPRLAAFASTPANSRASRQHIIRELGRVGTVASAPALIALLSDVDVGADAAMALERLADAGVDAAVLAALPSSQPSLRGQMIAILGQRRVASAVPQIAPCLRDADASLAATAVAALGHIATPEAARELIVALPALEGTARTAAWDALLACLAGAVSTGNDRMADAVVLALDKPDAPPHVRAAGTLALLKSASSRDSTLKATRLLESNDPAQQAAGAQIARLQTTDRDLVSVLAKMDKLPPTSQIALMGIIEDRRLTVAAPIVARLAASSDPVVRKAALRTLGPAGRADSIATLLAAASGGDEEARIVARKALRLVAGQGVDAAILGAAGTGTPAVRTEVIRCLGDRGVTAGLPLLFTAVSDPDATIRTEAVRQIGALAGAREWPRLLDLLAAAGDADRQSIVTAAEMAALRMPSPGEEVAVRLRALPPASVRASLLTLAGKLSLDATLPELQKAAGDSDSNVRNAALRALGAWTKSSALPALKEAASGSDPQACRLAQRGAIQVVRKATDLDPAARVARYRELAPKAEHVDEQKQLLSAVAELSGAEALAVASGFLDKPAVRAEAEAAVIQIAKRSGKPDAATVEALKRIAAESSAQAMKDEAAALLK